MVRFKLSFTTRGFDLRFEFNRQLANAGFAHRFQPAQRFFDDSPLVFREIRLARNATELAFVITGARRPHSFNCGLIHRDGHRGNSCQLDGSRGEADRLMTEFGRGNQECALHVVVSESIDKTG